MKPAKVEVVSGPTGYSTTISVTVKPEMKIFDTMLDAEIQFESLYPTQKHNPFHTDLQADKKRRCYIISSVAGLKSSTHGHWVVRITDERNAVSQTLSSLHITDTIVILMAISPSRCL